MPQPTGWPASISLSAAQSPLGTPIILTWVDELVTSPPTAGGGYVSNPAFVGGNFFSTAAPYVSLVTQAGYIAEAHPGSFAMPGSPWYLVAQNPTVNYLVIGYNYNPTFSTLTVNSSDPNAYNDGGPFSGWPAQTINVDLAIVSTFTSILDAFVPDIATAALQVLVSGSGVLYRGVINGTYNPITGKFEASNANSWRITCSPPLTYNTVEKRNSQIVSGDFRILVGAQGIADSQGNTTVPFPDDRIDIGAASKFKIINVDAIMSGQLAALYDCQCRF